MTIADGNNKDIFAVFRMHSWMRDLSPIEIFDSKEDAKKFIEKNYMKFISNEFDELRIYARGKTDWILLPLKEIS